MVKVVLLFASVHPWSVVILTMQSVHGDAFVDHDLYWHGCVTAFCLH